jgi:hypothetical protein
LALDLRMNLRKTLRMPARTSSVTTEEAPAPPRRIPVNLSLPEDLVRQLDGVSGPRNRSAFAEEAIRKAIRREQLRVSIERTAGSLPADRYPHWRTSGQVVAWVREARAEVTTTEPHTP